MCTIQECPSQSCPSSHANQRMHRDNGQEWHKRRHLIPHENPCPPGNPTTRLQGENKLGLQIVLNASPEIIHNIDSLIILSLSTL